MVPWTGIIIIIIVSMFRNSMDKRHEDFVTAMWFSTFTATAPLVHYLLAGLLATTVDTQLLALDHSLGFNTVWFADEVTKLHLLMVVLILAYVFLPAVIGIAWATEQNKIFRTAVILGAFSAVCGYVLCPAVGPGHYNFTLHLADGSPRNCMPSMHLTWAFLIAFNAQKRRYLYIIYAALIATATVALREHYFIDLVAAVPFALLLQFIVVNLYREVRLTQLVRLF